MGSPVTFPVTLDRQDGSTVLEGELTATDGLPADLPAWFQSGAGDPVSANPTVPNTVGGLYFDTTGNTGLWAAAGPAAVDWLALGNIDPSPGPGVAYSLNAPGVIDVYIVAKGALAAVILSRAVGHR